MPDIDVEIEIDGSAQKVFEAITTHAGLSGWWAQNCDIGEAVGEQSEFRFDDGAAGMVVKARVDAMEPEKSVLWTVVDNSKHDGWIGTTVNFSLSESGKGTKLKFTHVSFPEEMPGIEQAAGGLQHFLQSLKSYVETGTGTPMG